MLINTAIAAIKKRKLRSLLTTLGIIIGIIAIIVVTAIGEGAKVKINQAIQNLGTNFVIVLSTPQRKLAMPGRQPTPNLKPADVTAIERECDDIALMSPGFQSFFKAVYGAKNWPTLVGGVVAHYPVIRNWAFSSGNFFTQQDVQSRAKVAVLGKTVAAELFGDENPVGKMIRIKRIPFKIIGVIAEQGKRPDGVDQDDIIMIPISTMVKRLRGGSERYSAIIMSAKTEDSMPRIASQVRAILRQSRKLKDAEDDDFTVFTQADVVQASNAAERVLGLLLFIIAFISLVVGGIGIMNIMMITVTERTREIGLRMAIGATTSDIRNQFLCEAITICLFGGLSGIMLGIALSHIIGMTLGWPIFVSMQAVVISLSSSIAIGIFFGYYPARKASLLDPVNALVEK